MDRIIASLRHNEVRALVKELEKRKRYLKILNAGGGEDFGTGINRWLRSRGHRVVVLDISGRADVIADLNNYLPFSDGSFDLVISLAVVEHLNNWQQALHEFKRVAGYVIITTPAPASRGILEFLAFKLKVIDAIQIKDHRHYLSKAELEEAGYTVKTFELGLNQLAYYGFTLPEAVISPWLVLFLFLFVKILVHPTLPPDDILRHLKAYLYNYDYRNLYIYSYSPGFDPYLLFDAAAGLSHRVLGTGRDFLPFQALAIFLNGAGFILLTRRIKNNFFQVSLLLIYLYFAQGRLLLGRPAVIEAGLFLIAYALHERYPHVVHFLYGCFMASFYHAFFIFTLPLMLVRRIYFLSTLAGIAGWYLYGGGEYFKMLFSLSSLSVSRGIIAVQENRTILSVLATGFLFIPFLLYWRKDIKKTITTLYFCLSNQVRFMDAVLPLSLSFAEYIPVKSVPGIVLFVLMLSAGTAGVSYLNPPIEHRFKENSRILCDGMIPMYSIIYFSKERIKVAPSMNINWTDREVLKTIKRLRSGRFDCTMADKFDYVVESSLKEIPSCLKLISIEGKYRIWQTE